MVLVATKHGQNYCIPTVPYFQVGAPYTLNASACSQASTILINEKQFLEGMTLSKEVARNVCDRLHLNTGFLVQQKQVR